jgi:hypothetical protein
MLERRVCILLVPRLARAVCVCVCAIVGFVSTPDCTSLSLSGSVAPRAGCVRFCCSFVRLSVRARGVVCELVARLQRGHVRLSLTRVWTNHPTVACHQHTESSLLDCCALAISQRFFLSCATFTHRRRRRVTLLCLAHRLAAQINVTTSSLPNVNICRFAGGCPSAPLLDIMSGGCATYAAS